MSAGPTTSSMILYGVTTFLDNKMLANNERIGQVKNPNTVFSCIHPCEVSLSRYIVGLMKNFRASSDILVMMLIYIERLLERLNFEYMAQKGTDPILFTSFNAHKITLTAFLLAFIY
mmetsp:Transcript_23122/g.26514  ORF Transcript_23122/g.26514 Transcript_23122/m.26514 type:complete len:117 (+) Transcript_23122:38-388(+)